MGLACARDGSKWAILAPGVHYTDLMMARVAASGLVSWLPLPRPLALGALFSLATALALVLPGYLLEGARAPLTTTDAIIVISGDGDLARFREGLRLFESGWAPRLIFSGAALEDEPSNAEVMRDLAVEAGVPPSAILLDHQASNTHGNALGTRDLMTDHGLSSAILVTSPYHLNRASITFRAVFSEAGLHVVPWPAPDQSWRKANWWRSAETRSLTFVELEKLGYIAITGRYS